MPGRKLRVSFPEEGLEAVAQLLEDEAPATCRAIWEQLEASLESEAVHAMWSGPEISFQIPAAQAHPALSQVPRENQTIYPPPGSLVWAHLPARVWGGNPQPVFDIGIFYAAQGRVFLPIGWMPVNHFAQVQRGSEDFLDCCRRMQREGAKRIRLARVPDKA